MGTKVRSVLVAVMSAALLAGGIVIMLDQRELRQLRAEIAALQVVAQDADRLKTENQALRQREVNADELERLRKQTQEIHRLRAQYREMQQLQQDHATLQREHEELKAVHQQLVRQQQVLRSQVQSFAAAGAAGRNPATTTPAGAWLGVSIQTLAENREIQSLNPGVSQGVVVTSVIPGTPAEQAGLQSGDIVVAIDEMEVTTAAQMREMMATKKVGQRVVLDVYRGGLVHKIGIVAAAIPQQSPQGE